MVTPLPNETIPKFDKRDQDTRYFESRAIETELLADLKYLYEVLVKNMPANSGGRRSHESSIENDLRRRYNENLLGSGGVGEAFNRLLGSGIMKDLPQIEGPTQNTSGFGVKVIKRPTNFSDIGLIEVTTFVGKSAPFSNCRFTFETSLDAISQRASDINQENEAKRREIYGSQYGH